MKPANGFPTSQQGFAFPLRFGFDAAVEAGDLFAREVGSSCESQWYPFF
jgi:hypothetical protein